MLCPRTLPLRYNIIIPILIMNLPKLPFIASSLRFLTLLILLYLTLLMGVLPVFCLQSLKILSLLFMALLLFPLT